MSGSTAGTGQPLTLKCSKCKLSRAPSGSARCGKLVRTGRSKPRPKRGFGYGRGHIRIGDKVHECRCLECGHIGWYAHHDVKYLPLEALA